jgi:hypothetical protein
MLLLLWDITGKWEWGSNRWSKLKFDKLIKKIYVFQPMQQMPMNQMAPHHHGAVGYFPPQQQQVQNWAHMHLPNGNQNQPGGPGGVHMPQVKINNNYEFTKYIYKFKWIYSNSSLKSCLLLLFQCNNPLTN